MSPDPVLRRIHACCLAAVPVFLWSEPGAGKTSRIRGYSEALSLHLERWLLSRCEPIDLKPRAYDANGRPVVHDPPEIERLIETSHQAIAAKDGRPFWGVMFCDEANLATRETENAALDRMDAPPKGIAVIAAGNPPTRGQAARSLGAAAANRFCHLDVTVDARAFSRAMVEGWPMDPGHFPAPDAARLATARSKTAMLVSSFIARRPELLSQCPADPVQAGRGWASTRTWDYAVRVYAVAAALDLDVEDKSALLTGLLGAGPATEFLAYCIDADLVDPEAWLAAPTSVTVDKNRIDRVVAALTAVVHAVQSNTTEARWVAAWKIVGHVMASDGMSAAMVGGDMLIAFYRNLAKSPAAVAALTQPHKLLAAHAPRMAALLV